MAALRLRASASGRVLVALACCSIPDRHVFLLSVYVDIGFRSESSKTRQIYVSPWCLAGWLIRKARICAAIPRCTFPGVRKVRKRASRCPWPRFVSVGRRLAWRGAMALRPGIRSSGACFRFALETSSLAALMVRTRAKQEGRRAWPSVCFARSFSAVSCGPSSLRLRAQRHPSPEYSALVGQ